MKIEVHFFGDTKRFLPAAGIGRRATVEIPAGSNVDALCDHLGMGDEAVVIMVNDIQHHRGTVLDAGDAVTFLPSLVGGASAAHS
jgi:sulfur carrier protein ThiS